MPKRRKKRRGKRREPQQQMPRPNRGGEQPLRPDAVLPTTVAVQAEQAVASASLDDNDTGKAADRTIISTVLGVERGFIWIETEGTRAKLYASELMLDIGEVTADRYAPGDHFEAFVFQMEPDPESGAPQFSIRRAAPYLDALNRLEVGSVVANATVVNTYDLGIELDIDGLRGNAFSDELPLGSGESPHDQYQPGETIDDLFVWEVHHDTRNLLFSVRRNAPGYVEALNAHSVGDVVSATITAFQGNGGLWLDVDGVSGSVSPDELPLAEGESAQDCYTVGDPVHDLFVWQINDDRSLALSVRRNAPGYVEALNAYSVGDVVSATVTRIPRNGGLWIDVDGVLGTVEPQELPPVDVDSVQDHYDIGDTIHDLFVRRVSHDTRGLYLSVRRNAPGYVEALNTHKVGDVVSATVTVLADDGGLWLDAGGVIGGVSSRDLALYLAADESTQDHYAIGDTVHNLYVWGVDHDDRELFLSVRLNTPGYVEALNAHSVGDVVSATVTDFQSNGGLVLSVGGVIGAVGPQELPLANGESAQDRYTVGDTVHDLFVLRVDHDARFLSLSVKRNVSGYVEALNTHSVGDVVSATVTGFQSNGGLWLDVGGVIGNVAPDELSLAVGESAQDRYVVGETIDDLFVWVVDARQIALSLKRNVPGYLEALQRHTIGEVVSGTITFIDGSLWLDVNGVIGVVVPQEFDLADGESVLERYAVGEKIGGLFVWAVDHNAQMIGLSLKRNARSYVEALQRRVVGEVVSGPITSVETEGLTLDVHGLFAAIPASELQLDAGQSPQQRYSVGKTIAARVWMIDRTSRAILLSARRHAAGSREEQVERGATIDAVVRGTTPRDVRMPIRVLTTYSESSVEILPHALSLSTGMPPRFEDNQTIRVVVVELDDEGRPTRLSHRQALDGWEAEMRRLSHDTVVPNARPVPPEALSEAERNAGAAAVDLGPITGVIPEDELDRETGQYIATYNETYRVVVESVDDERRIATVSHERFEERWQAVAGQLELEDGAEVEGELRDFDKETALFDLGSGLLAQMPARELPDSDPPGKAEIERIGERFPLRITNFEPGKQTVHVEPRNQWLEALINEPESETLEFKEVLRGSGKNERRGMTHEAMRTITGFLNTSGGKLVIGVSDDGKVVGLEIDDGLTGPTMVKKIDSANKILQDNMKNVMPLNPLNVHGDLRDLVTWATHLVRGRTLLVVTCQRGPDDGVWLLGRGQPRFWIRQGQETTDLDVQNTNAISAHLRNREQRSTASDEGDPDE